MTDHLILLGLTTGLLCAAALMPQARMKWPLWLRATWAITIFLIITIMLTQIIGSPLLPRYDIDHPGVEFWEKLIEAGWWLMMARGAIGLMRLFVVLEDRARETQIVSDLIASAIYIATILALIDFVFEVPIGGLLATSGIIAIVLGLALQNTLSDVFSGIAVGLERPYKVGDLIWVEGGIEGRVIQVTWRSTHVGTGRNDIAIIPNSVIAKSRLVNRSRPTTIRSDTVEIRLDATVSADRSLDVLTAAARSCRLLLADPSPEVICVGLNGDGCVYQIAFAVASSSQLAPARNELLVEIHRHLRYSGIALAVAGAAVLLPVSVPTPSQLLEQSDLFGVIEPEQRDLLAQHFTTVWRQPGETLIREGSTADALFVIASGAAEVTINTPDGPRVVHKTSPGECLGAIGLITGSAYAATATALTVMRAYQLDKDAIAAAIKIQPELAQGLEALARRGQAALRRDAAAAEDEKQDHPDMFLAKLRIFVQLLKSR
jgi:small-conductance mechanosensitive channel/CRP-like cAMP-binding protein